MVLLGQRPRCGAERTAVGYARGGRATSVSRVVPRPEPNHADGSKSAEENERSKDGGNTAESEDQADST
ncbi:hypothetical protein BDV96DRAFT_573264 [Lophiotrema nucula]|uniref:Uncharacterized protein n=1 Tax=Lophiotrema nucula TaxID=690887 RepID=A0A6A5Z957_9PLEO|nr:hypothetical protein BDV96DRAFT_573264 [Lophiotrema nucula]